MLLLNSIFSLGLISSVVAVALPASEEKLACGNANIIFTGLPPYHPMVSAQGWDPLMVDTNLKADARAIIAAGYNLRTVFMGPEQNISVFAKYLDGTEWAGAGVGFGIRGTRLPDLTVRLEDILKVFREKAPRAEVMFNYSPNSTLWTLRRRVPLERGCGLGRDLGYTEVYDICKS